MMTIQPHSVRSAPPPCALPSTYNDFLYAPVGEDKNGVFLTVLSMLARQNVDPWEEAADLNRLPRDSAKQKLVSMITASSGRPQRPPSSRRWPIECLRYCRVAPPLSGRATYPRTHRSRVRPPRVPDC